MVNVVALLPSPIPYKSNVKLDSLPKQKVHKKTTRNSSHTSNVEAPTFSGSEGLEALLLVENFFLNKVTDELQLTEAEQLAKFKGVLSQQAEEDWKEVVAAQQAAPPAPAAAGAPPPSPFRTAMNAFYLRYCDERARDSIVRFVREFRHDETITFPPINRHTFRIRQMLKWANQLPGTIDTISEDQILLMLFDTFPAAWKHTFKNGNTTLNSVVHLQDFMRSQREHEKEQAQLRKQEANNKRKADYQGNRNRRHNGGRNSNNGGRGGGRNHSNGRGGRGSGSSLSTDHPIASKSSTQNFTSGDEQPIASESLKRSHHD